MCVPLVWDLGDRLRPAPSWQVVWHFSPQSSVQNKHHKEILLWCFLKRKWDFCDKMEMSSSSSQQRDMKDIISHRQRHFLLICRRWRWDRIKDCCVWHLEVICLSQRAPLQICGSSWLCLARLTHQGIVTWLKEHHWASSKMDTEVTLMLRLSMLYLRHVIIMNMYNRIHSGSTVTFITCRYVTLVWCRGRHVLQVQ